jgi:hypothetical protein
MAHQSTNTKDLAEIERAVEQIEALVVQLRHALDRAIKHRSDRQKTGDSS